MEKIPLSKPNTLEDIQNNNDLLAQLLEGSDIEVNKSNPKETYQGWEEDRRYIADLIDEDGSILDYGCANGFLIKCLREWSDHTLDACGIDINEQRLEEASRFLNTPRGNFFNINDKSKDDLISWLNGKKKFTYIHWNIWDNLIEESIKDTASNKIDEFINFFKQYLDTNGKLILSSYHSDGEISSLFKKQLETRYLGTTKENIQGNEFSFILE